MKQNNKKNYKKKRKLKNVFKIDVLSTFPGVS